MDEPAVGPRAPVEGGKAHAELLQAQMRDARNKIFKLEEVFGLTVTYLLTL